MNLPKSELRFAAEVILPVVVNVYERYQDGHTSVIAPDVQHLADIQADTNQMHALQLETDRSVHAMMSGPAANASIFGAVDFHTPTSTLVIAFRGTKNPSEWLDDFEILPVQFTDIVGPHPLVHAGFLHVWRLAKNSLAQALSSVPAFESVIVTGHSLGGAVAALCALETLAKEGYANLKCWTYASPRTFFLTSRRFDDATGDSLRIFNPVDIVTQSPPIPWVGVKGGLAIRPNFTEPHSLLDTYQPGIESLIASAPATTMELLPGEADMLSRVV